MAKKSSWVLILTVVSTAIVLVFYFIREQPRDQANILRSRDDLADSVAEAGSSRKDNTVPREWCRAAYGETAKLQPIPTLSQTQIKSLASRTPLPQKVSSLPVLFQAPWGTIVLWDSTKDLVQKYDFHPQKASFTVGVVTTAIGKYIQFLDGFISFADKYFLSGERLTYVIFTDHVNEARKLPSDRPKIIFREENMGWPRNALMLYEFLNKYNETLITFDYVYVFDVDITIEAEVGQEILGMRVGTIHPSFFHKPRSEFSYDQNPKSTAYVDKSVEGVYYFAGALFGGCSKEVATMASVIHHNVHKDLEIDYIAVWHDESHLNRQVYERGRGRGRKGGREGRREGGKEGGRERESKINESGVRGIVLSQVVPVSHNII